MTPTLYFLICAALLLLSLFLLKNKTPFTSRRKESYVKLRQNIRLVGVFLLFLSGLSLTLGIFMKVNSIALPESYVPLTHGSFAPGRLTNAAPLAAKVPEIPKIDPAVELKKQKDLDLLLGKLNARLVTHPEDPVAYGDRGNVYATRKQWELAEKDYESALTLNPKLAKAAFNLAEMMFVQKRYDDARPGFVALTSDKNLGELATYKVFLCDLFGGHATVADKELVTFNEVGTGASFYFANIAWCVYHHKTDSARGWLNSAQKIYQPYKLELFSTSLTQLGYLPLPEEHPELRPATP